MVDSATEARRELAIRELERRHQSGMTRVEAVGRGFADGFSVGFGDEVSGLVAASRAGPQGLDRFRDDEGNFFTDAWGAANDAYGRVFPAFDAARGGVAMLTGPTDEQRQAYETTRDSMRDGLVEAQEAHPVSTLGGQIGGGILSAAMTGGASASPSVARAAAVGAGYGGTYGIGSGEGLADRAIQGAQGAVIGGVTGGVAQSAMNLGGAAIRRIFGTSRPSVSQIDDALQRGQIDDATAQRLRDADELGVSLTRGQQTGSRTQLAFEEAARRDRARSEPASRMIQSFDEAQSAQLASVQDDIAQGVGQGRRVADDALDASALLQRRLQSAAATSQQRIDDAYATARQYNTTVRADAVEGLGQRVRHTLSQGDNPIIIDDRLTPGAMRALEEIDQLSGLRIQNAAQPGSRAVVPAGEQIQIAGVSIQGLEQVRRRLNSLYRGAANDPGDRRAVRAVIAAYDDWLDDAAANSLLQGTQEGLEAYQHARATFRQHRQMFGQQGRYDSAGRLIERLIDEDAATTRLPEVANAIFGTASSGEGRVSLQMAQRVRQIFGQNSEEMAALRQGLFARVIGINERSEVGTDALIRNFRVLLDGPGRGMANTLYTREQLGQMRRLYRVLQSIRTPRDLQNPSGTAGALIRQHSQGLTRSLLRGVPLAGDALDSLITVLTGAQGQRQAREALRGVLVPQGVGVPGAMSGVAGYSGLEAYQQN